MKHSHRITFMFISALLVMSCTKKNDSDTSSPGAKTFLDITFNRTTAYFSTDGSMQVPVDSNQAKTMAGKIDLTFIYNFDYKEPGFLDPVARSKDWYWDEYYQPWLSSAIENRFYSTTLSKSDFDAAQKDQSKIGAYFSLSTTVLAPHAIFPTGSCVGGRQSFSPNSVLLEKGLVLGFKNTVSGKRGLIYIRTDQPSGWPYPISTFNTKVDIIREN